MPTNCFVSRDTDLHIEAEVTTVVVEDNINMVWNWNNYLFMYVQ